MRDSNKVSVNERCPKGKASYSRHHFITLERGPKSGPDGKHTDIVQCKVCGEKFTRTIYDDLLRDIFSIKK